MKRIILLAIFAVIFVPPMFSADKNDDKNAGIFYKENYCYAVGAPKGWVLDSKSGRMNGLQVVFYKEGSNWSDAESVIYINVSSKNENKTVENIIKNDVDSFKKRNKDLKVEDASDVKMDDKKGIVKYFLGGKDQNYEAVGYLDEEKVVILFILSSRNEKGFKESLPAFKELLQSYFRMELESDKGAVKDDSIILSRTVRNAIQASGDRKLKIK
jgi:hypothetical protein